VPSWKLSAVAPKAVVEAALDAHAALDEWDGEIALSGREIAADRPDEWVFEAWMPRKPTAKDRWAIRALFDDRPPRLKSEQLPPADWLTLSQQGAQPIRAGRFHVHTPDYAASDDPAVRSFAIPASQAFGTGHHETTAGCLAMLTAMKARGVVARDLADIGTGTGLLAFAALDLWPRARATASDIDPVCAGVVDHNAALNGIASGHRPGELTMLVADGMDDPLLRMRAPFDLLIANILARPLIDMAPDLAGAVADGGHVLLAGLLETQERAVRRAWRRAGFRLAARLVEGDWSILWLRKRRTQ